MSKIDKFYTIDSKDIRSDNMVINLFDTVKKHIDDIKLRDVGEIPFCFYCDQQLGIAEGKIRKNYFFHPRNKEHCDSKVISPGNSSKSYKRVETLTMEELKNNYRYKRASKITSEKEVKNKNVGKTEARGTPLNIFLFNKNLKKIDFRKKENIIGSQKEGYSILLDKWWEGNNDWTKNKPTNLMEIRAVVNGFKTEETKTAIRLRVTLVVFEHLINNRDKKMAVIITDLHGTSSKTLKTNYLLGGEESSVIDDIRFISFTTEDEISELLKKSDDEH